MSGAAGSSRGIKELRVLLEILGELALVYIRELLRLKVVLVMKNWGPYGCSAIQIIRIRPEKRQ